MREENRIKSIFKCIVDLYTETAIPVGSRAVSRVYGGNLSPASIRNVMMDLEEMGLISQPHTSAGRIPTNKGYRFYVDEFLSDMCSEEELKQDKTGSEVWGDSDDFDDVAEKASRYLAYQTHNASVFLMKKIHRHTFFDDLLEHKITRPSFAAEMRDRLVVDGASMIFEQPEFSDIQRAKELLRAFELKQELTSFLERGLEDDATHVYIGEEVDCQNLKHVSVVAKKYSRRGKSMGCLGVIGPTRMNYYKTVQVVDELADSITDFLNEI